MNVFHQLVAPLRYLRVQNEGRSKVLIDFVLPCAAGLGAALLSVWYPALIPIRGANGVVTSIGGLLQTLVGFYVAALAAVAAFGNPSLDQPTLGITIGKEVLLRRRFLALLFGYLSFVAMALYVVSVFSSIPEAVVASVASVNAKAALRFSCWFLYFGFFAQMLSVTLFGLYYLVDRIHRVDQPVVVAPSAEQTKSWIRIVK